MFPNRPAPPRITMDGLPFSGHLQVLTSGSEPPPVTDKIVKIPKMMNFDDFMLHLNLKTWRENC